MKNFVLAITSCNRKDYLQECIESWNKTRSLDNKWKLIIADDGSTDATLEYLESLELMDVEIYVIKNNKIGVHQQMNTILKELEKMNFDFCFKVDDDLTFLKSGWDELYYKTAIETGNHHLVFCDETWSEKQLLKKAKTTTNLVGKVPMLQVNGIFYTITPEILKSVGYMDVASFGFRGMGHVDYTMRCARAGFTNAQTPWDVNESNAYLSAIKENYNSVLPSTAIGVYDSYFRKEKEKIIQQENREYIAMQAINNSLFSQFREQLIIALSAKVELFEAEKTKLVDWYEQEIEKIKAWNTNQYKHLPRWYLSLGKVFKLFAKK